MIDTTVEIPIWSLITGAIALAATVASGVWWWAATFFKKEDALELEKLFNEKLIAQGAETKKLEERLQEQIQRHSIENKERFEKLTNWVSRLDTAVNNVAKDTTYIRGWIDGQIKERDS